MIAELSARDLPAACRSADRPISSGPSSRQASGKASLATLEVIRDRLLAVGLRPTVQRIAILQAPDQAGHEALEKKAIFRRVFQGDQAVGMAAFYRMMLLLEKHGLLRQAPSAGGKQKYRFQAQPDDAPEAACLRVIATGEQVQAANGCGSTMPGWNAAGGWLSSGKTSLTATESSGKGKGWFCGPTVSGVNAQGSASALLARVP